MTILKKRCYPEEFPKDEKEFTFHKKGNKVSLSKQKD